MKTILGLDLGTTSIGFAHIIEDEDSLKSSIKQIGVRVNPLTTDEQTNFEKGKPVTINADRTLKRGARRGLDRYQDRRSNLIHALAKAKLINYETKLAEDGKKTTHSTFALRSKAVIIKIEKEELARIFLSINKKRGYKSSRKAKNAEDGQAIDSMAIAKRLYEEKLTPGQLVFRLLEERKRTIPDFYRSDLQAEFDKVWLVQKKESPEIFTDEFYKELQGKGQRATSALFWLTYQFNIAENKAKTKDAKKLQAYKWRSDAISQQLTKEEAAFVITEINSNINNSSGYLGAISDRSKELYFNKETVGQNLYKQLQNNPHTKLKNQVFYRQDYLDEFEAIWLEQAKHHPELTDDLKSEIRDIIIFYQRKLKSKKGLISFCEFESKEIEIDKNGEKAKQRIGLKVAPKSSLLFQEFKIWQRLNDIQIRRKPGKINNTHKDIQSNLIEENSEIFILDLETKQKLFEELNLKGNLSSAKIIELLGHNPIEWEMNFSELEGNRTNLSLYNAYLTILEIEGYNEELLKLTDKDEINVSELKTSASDIKIMVKSIFQILSINTDILEFNSELEGKAFEQQASYQLWHLLYSYEEDNSGSGNEKLYELLATKFGFKREHSIVLANISFSEDYGNLSTKAMRKIIIHLKQGFAYAGRKDMPTEPSACEYAGYRHSAASLTKDEIENRILNNKLDLLKKNSLRNPVVEKILNQLVNVVNTLIEKNSKRDTSGKIIEHFHFDEIRIELARDLKKNAKERAEMTTNINAAKIIHDKIFKLLQTEFGVKNPTRNDIIRYRLYEELKNNGYKDLYTDTYIPREILFSKQIDIEHIIPQSLLFDDSFSNKTVVYRKDNLNKGNKTAIDYIESTYGESALAIYLQRIELLFEQGKKSKDDPTAGISKAKHQKLLKKASAIGDGFIERDLRDSQYIAKQARNMLYGICRVVTPTTGSVTDRLREDWDLINVMKELNLPKFRALGLTEMQERKYGQQVEVIKDWTKRNDHRHHAMDALTVAFTKHSHIQYLNFLNARKNEHHKLHSNIIAIENKETEIKIDDNGNRKRVFKLPVLNFRHIAKEHLEDILVSHKAKNKVVTKNKNKTASKKGEIIKVELTPRGQLHKETVYGRYNYYVNKIEKINAKFDESVIDNVANPLYKNLLLQRLHENGNDAKKAFSGKNALNKTPIYLNLDKTETMPESVKISWLEQDFSIRKDITPENFKDEKTIEKVIDAKVKQILLNRLKQYGDAKKAFSDLEKAPIWLNEKKGICIKRVAISGVKNAEFLHYKKDHLGKAILDSNGKKIPVDFVSTGNNHHVAIYRDEHGSLQEKVVSLFEAVKRVNLTIPIIVKDPKTVWDWVISKGIDDQDFLNSLPPENWQFFFTMKQNEFFVFPNEKTGFNPKEVDLLDPKNRKMISPNLFRVQKISTKNYVFNNHLETKAIDGDILKNNKELAGIMYHFIRTPSNLEKLIKIRLNHLGEIVKVGDY